MNESGSSNSPIMLGLFQQMPLPAVSRYLAHQGWKWVVLDLVRSKNWSVSQKHLQKAVSILPTF